MSTTHGFRFSNKCLGHAQLPFTRSDSDIAKYNLGSGFCISFPGILAGVGGTGREKIEPLNEFIKELAIGKTSSEQCIRSEVRAKTVVNIFDNRLYRGGIDTQVILLERKLQAKF